MSLSRGDVTIEWDEERGGGYFWISEASPGGKTVTLTADDLRWLVTTAGPAALSIVAPLATGVPEPRPATAAEPTPPAQASLLDP